MNRHDPNNPVFRAAELATLLARHYPAATPGRIATVIGFMQDATRAAKSWELKLCNESMPESQQVYGRKVMERTQSLINGWLQQSDMLAMDYSGGEKHPHPAHIDLGGDCRGSCGTLYIPGAWGDSMGGKYDGFPIY
jgi:hypothetical protein